MPNEEMKYEVRNEEIEKILVDIGHRIGSQMPKGYGFMLQIFSYGEGGDLFYISSAQRGDIINVMKEFIEKYEENNDTGKPNKT